MKKYLIFSIIGIALFIGGCFTGYYYGLPDKNIKTDLVKTTQISGEKIVHTPIKVKKNTIEFNTIADGKGEIKTVIQKEVVPEARYWLEKTNIVQIGIDNKYNLSVAYLKRFGVFAIGGGVSITTQEIMVNEIRVFALGQYMF